MKKIIDKLLQSAEPSIRYRVLINVLGENPGTQKMKNLQKEIKSSKRVQTLLSRKNKKGQLEPVRNPYQKWTGAHWILASLADLHYPAGEKSIQPVMDQVLDCWLNPDWVREIVYTEPYPKKYKGIPVINGLTRRCGSQQGSALLSSIKLGLIDERTDKLAELLMRWQWPDGGWNCDKKPEAKVSSFHETHLPLRGLALYYKLTHNKKILAAVQKGTELFLKRKLFRRLADNEIMNNDFIQLHYPVYWHYDFLTGLKVLLDADCLNDTRCSEALDLLEKKQLTGSGWPLEAKYYKGVLVKKDIHSNKKIISNMELVSWGTAHKKVMNEWVTADALSILVKAKRIRV